VGRTPGSPVLGGGTETSGRRDPHRNIRIASGSASRVKAGGKRTFDALVALALLTAVLPLFLLVAVAVKLDSRGPVFYRVRRVGYRGRPLMMLKFRKMHDDAEGIPLTTDADVRLTRIGKVLARTRLDELPQLWDVLRGRMSIVGPRPEDPGFVALYADAYEHILTVRPGITGLSQLAFAEEHKILDEDDLVADYVERILPQKIGLDTMYVDSYRIRTDLAVLRWTAIAMILRRPVAVHRSTGRMNVRKRPRPAAVTAVLESVT
jgi:lipopolysaccharide/colanic/teichoic acid biosynthesis glycosyltransferase